MCRIQLFPQQQSFIHPFKWYDTELIRTTKLDIFPTPMSNWIRTDNKSFISINFLNSVNYKQLKTSLAPLCRSQYSLLWLFIFLLSVNNIPAKKILVLETLLQTCLPCQRILQTKPHSVVRDCHFHTEVSLNLCRYICSFFTFKNFISNWMRFSLYFT